LVLSIALRMNPAGFWLGPVARRIATRHEHFMPRSLLHSQFEALEEPGPGETPVIVSIEPQPLEIVAKIMSALTLVENVHNP
jgi:gluconate kinase